MLEVEKQFLEHLLPKKNFSSFSSFFSKEEQTKLLLKLLLKEALSPPLWVASKVFFYDNP